ncbi:neuronal acetylcholine receptor subunit alpha-10-like [Ostrea edulis]|uniref:neuronal acetylcholine receptor subunit alpha-10-like n=1 Tax=Ostrea edulis TaxID=37623 RepID=UPI002094D9AE|nr:neuronal acetylcholine receptor subunit alpha-10-like [Ostrea edulis]
MWWKCLMSTFGLLFPVALGSVVSSDNNGYFLASLYKSLLEGNYTSAIRPHCSEKALNVTIDVGLREIVDLSEKQETIKLKIWVRLKWEDCNLTWNTSDFGGISKMVVPYDKIWIPDVTLLEGINEIANMPDTLITNLGEVYYQFQTTVHMTCGMNIAKFPFDHQMCTITFAPWMHTNREIDMFSKSDTGDLSSFVINQEWVVVSLKATKITELYNCCDEPFSSISYKLVIKRKATFYIITMILPFFALTILSIAGFVLPSISGEKIAFHMNILLAVTVFLLLIQDTLPSSSEFFPTIGIYFTITLLLTCLSCVMSAIVLYLFYHDLSGKQMPEWVRKFFVQGLGRLMFIKPHTLIPVKSQANSQQDTVRENAVRRSVIPTDKFKKNRKSIKPTVLMGVQNAIYDDWEKELGDVQLRNQTRATFMETDKSVYSEANKMNEWELLAYTLDRFFTVFYIFVTIINTTAFLIVLSQNDEP